MTINTTQKVTVEVAEAAVETITRCTEHSAAVLHAWGYVRSGAPQEAIDTMASWAKAQSTLLTGGWGPADVYRDGELSFTVSTPHIFFGLIFSPTGQGYADVPLADDVDPAWAGAVRLGRYCDHLTGHKRCAEAVRGGNCPVHGEVPAGEALLMPVTGTWSFHS